MAGLLLLARNAELSALLLGTRSKWGAPTECTACCGGVQQHVTAHHVGGRAITGCTACWWCAAACESTPHWWAQVVQHVGGVQLHVSAHHVGGRALTGCTACWWCAAACECTPRWWARTHWMYSMLVKRGRAQEEDAWVSWCGRLSSSGLPSALPSLARSLACRGIAARRVCA